MRPNEGRFVKVTSWAYNAIGLCTMNPICWYPGGGDNRNALANDVYLGKL